MTTYHFVGIKGTGMSPLAQILHDMKYSVQGSDIEKHIFTQQALEERNISVLSFQAENIKDDQVVIAGNGNQGTSSLFSLSPTPSHENQSSFNRHSIVVSLTRSQRHGRLGPTRTRMADRSQHQSEYRSIWRCR